MTAAQKALALIDYGLAADLQDATEQLVDAGEIGQNAADKLLAKAAKKKAIAQKIAAETAAAAA